MRLVNTTAVNSALARLQDVSSGAIHLVAAGRARPDPTAFAMVSRTLLLAEIGSKSFRSDFITTQECRSEAGFCVFASILAAFGPMAAALYPLPDGP
jgi:hypothetical protein